MEKQIQDIAKGLGLNVTVANLSGNVWKITSGAWGVSIIVSGIKEVNEARIEQACRRLLRD